MYRFCGSGRADGGGKEEEEERGARHLRGGDEGDLSNRVLLFAPMTFDSREGGEGGGRGGEGKGKEWQTHFMR